MSFKLATLLLSVLSVSALARPLIEENEGVIAASSERSLLGYRGLYGKKKTAAVSVNLRVRDGTHFVTAYASNKKDSPPFVGSSYKGHVIRPGSTTVRRGSGRVAGRGFTRLHTSSALSRSPRSSISSSRTGTRRYTPKRRAPSKPIKRRSIFAPTTKKSILSSYWPGDMDLNTMSSVSKRSSTGRMKELDHGEMDLNKVWPIRSRSTHYASSKKGSSRRVASGKSSRATRRSRSRVAYKRSP